MVCRADPPARDHPDARDIIVPVSIRVLYRCGSNLWRNKLIESGEYFVPYPLLSNLEPSVAPGTVTCNFTELHVMSCEALRTILGSGMKQGGSTSRRIQATLSDKSNDLVGKAWSYSMQGNGHLPRRKVLTTPEITHSCSTIVESLP